jgi:class 3 adenylate cyclase
MIKPRTRYAKSGTVNIAYQAFGAGSIDLVYVPAWVSHVEYAWEEPSYARFLQRLGSFARIVMFDKRGTGLSDRDTGFPTLEERIDDIRAVMDATGSQRAAILGNSEGCNMAVLFAAVHPERTEALILFGAFAKRIWSSDYPWAPTPAEREQWFGQIEEGWGGVVDLTTLFPSRANDPAFAEWFSTYLRLGASPGAALTLARTNTQIDMRHVLPAVGAPTLVLHRRGDRDAKLEEGRYVAEHIPGAKFVSLDGEDHLVWAGDQDAALDEIEVFLTGSRRGPEIDRVLATVLFADIVESTRHAAALGDSRWRDLLSRYHRVARAEIARFRGRPINTAGDGFVAAFDGPARAIRCALAIREAVSELGVRIRSGIHCGECHIDGDTLAGMALHIGARIAAIAAADEVLVSSTVKDLVVGSGIPFESRGTRALKGVPGEWLIFQVGSRDAHPA